MNFTIRQAEAEDYEALRQIHVGPKVIWGTLQLPFPTQELYRKRMAETPEGLYRLIACVEEEVIGALHLNTSPNSPRRKHAGSLGMAVRDDWQGKGAGTALMAALVDLADNWLNLTRLELSVFTDNEPGVKLYQKFGFEIEGTLRDYAFRDGTYADVYAMARLKQRL